MKILPYISDGKLYHYDGNEIVEASILCNPVDDMLIKYGSYSTLFNMLGTYSANVKGVKLIKLDESTLGVEEMWYILLRCILFTQTGFIRNLYLYFQSAEFHKWLEKEMERIPLSLIKERLPYYEK